MRNVCGGSEIRLSCNLDNYVNWLKPVPWHLFGTFTFAWHVSDMQAVMVFDGFIDRMERAIRGPVAYLRGDEKRFSGCGMPGAPRHFHALLTAHRQLNRHFVADLWMSLAGRRENGSGADVRVYDPHLDGLEYVLKFINEPQGDWSLRNLDLFLPPDSFRPTNHRQRRRLFRHAKRLENK